MSNGVRFHWSDYLVFVLSIVLSACVGIFQTFFQHCRDKRRGRQAVQAEGKVVERNISIWPVSLSVMASTLAAPFVLGVPAEIYAYGTQFVFLILGTLIAMPFTTHLLYVRFYKLEITSIYEYLEFRFNKFVRSLCSAIFAFSIIIFIGIITYAPAVAFSQVTGLSMTVSVLGVGLIGIAYTIIGGLKGVIWVDAIQMLIILASILAVIIKGCMDVGGLQQVLHKSKMAGRIEAPVWSLHPQTRHTVWTQMIGGCVTTMVVITNQAIVQKFLGLKTIKQMHITAYISMGAMVLYFVLFSLAGLVIFAFYADCSPLLSGKIKSIDQLVPVFVLESFSEYYGVAGLFTAAVFSASLSTLAGGINALAAVTVLDVINPIYEKKTGLKTMNKTKMMIIFKLLILIYGLITIGFAYLAPLLGTGLLQLALNLMGVVGAPILAVFLMGVLMPCINALGASIGLVVSLISMIWIATGGLMMAGKYKRHLSLRLPFSNLSCPLSNSADKFAGNINSSLASNGETNITSLFGLTTLAVDVSAFQPVINNATIAEPMQPHGIEHLYMISYMWYSVLALIITFVVAFLVSWCTGFRKGAPVDPDLSFLCFYHREEQLTEKDPNETFDPRPRASIRSSRHKFNNSKASSPTDVAEQTFEEYDDALHSYGLFTRNRCSRCRRSTVTHCTRL